MIEGKRRNSKLYIHSGFTYQVHHENKASYNMRCQYWRVKSCKAGGKIDKIDDLFTPTGFHLHEAPDDVDVTELKGELKRKAETSSNALRELFDDVTAGADERTASAVSFNQVESTLLKRRRMVEPTLPTTALGAISRMEEFQDICPFYRGSVINGDENAIIFILENENMTSDTVGIDGTFKCCPRLFFQVLCLHFLHQDENNGRTHAVPFAICLLSNKTESLYRRVLSEIKNRLPYVTPSTIMADFEKGFLKNLRTLHHSEVNTIPIILNPKF